LAQPHISIELDELYPTHTSLRNPQEILRKSSRNPQEILRNPKKSSRNPHEILK
jgi:hypothetical protein